MNGRAGSAGDDQGPPGDLAAVLRRLTGMALMPTWPTHGRWLLVAAWTDVLAFSAATVVLALHVAADSFVATEPGTGPGDHLLRGAASLAILAVAAAVYPRLPTGGRAALAIVLGALALEGAALAVADAQAVGARGEDWTGFLLWPFGVLLVGSAGALLWRSRLLPGRPRPEGALEDRRSRARGRLPGASACVRGARHALLSTERYSDRGDRTDAITRGHGNRPVLAPARCRRSLGTPERQGLRGDHRIARPSRSPRPLPLGARGPTGILSRRTAGDYRASLVSW